MRLNGTTALRLAIAALAGVLAWVEMPPAEGRSVFDLASVIETGDPRVMETRHKDLFDTTGVAVVIVTVSS